MKQKRNKILSKATIQRHLAECDRFDRNMEKWMREHPPTKKEDAVKIASLKAMNKKLKELYEREKIR